ncbi:hypothetical protein CDD82_1694 [Ophiocordyceps australis]|uniref:Secreted protein n=1 Tax=Ophiocordyceps australis TaxID=1399860 RepID=A0A2C5ZKH7_9HYPO|nr:hypothetical protein CDD82_1694 [Ophiocordyceps australis]
MRFNTTIVASLMASRACASPSGQPVDASAELVARTLLPFGGGVDGTRGAASGFSCPRDMDYCPWTKACACAPGLQFDARSQRCAGSRMSGPWPEPKPEVYGSRGVPLQAYCAMSPYRMVRYHGGHEYCQAGLQTLAFVAHASIELELAKLGGADIDVGAPGVSPDLKAVVAGLAALYLESVKDAVALFNTDNFGLAVPESSVQTGLELGLLSSLRPVLCAIGLAKCRHDCVSYCSKGCRNYIDLGADANLGLGAHLPGLVGLCILPNILLVANAAHTVVTVGVEGLLCLVGAIFKNLLGLFSCNCA